MKQLINAYGNFLIEGIVMVLLINWMFIGVKEEENIGIFEIIGAQMTSEQENYSDYKDFRETYKKESTKGAPIIYFSGTHLTVGRNRLSDWIVIKDYSDNNLKPIVNSIKNINGTELVDGYDKITTEIVFQDAGIYIIDVEASDDCKRTSRCKMLIPVNY